MLNFKRSFYLKALAVGLLSLTVNLFSDCEPLCNLSCTEPWNEVSLSAGWRRDTIQTKYHEVDVTPESTGFILDDLKIKRLNVWEIGSQIYLSVPQFDNPLCEDWWWMDHFYVRGSAYRGWISKGHLQENSTRLIGTRNRHETATIHKGRTINASIGLGFSYPLSEDLTIGPIGGWAYDHIKTSCKDARYNGQADPAFNGSSYHSTWKGPWLGLDALYSICLGDCWQMKLDGGYEYHWADWKGGFRLKNADIEPCFLFSDHRRSHEAWGQVGRLNLWWTIYDCWDLGIGVKYQCWKSKKGKLQPRNGTFAEVGCNPSQKNHISHNTWHSIAVTSEFGYTF